MQIKIKIPGDPQAKMRHRSTKTGHVYDPNAENEDRAIAHIRHDVSQYHVPFVGACEAELEFVFARPKSHYRTGQNAHKVKPSAPVYCCNPKDVDNLQKFYLDALNAIVYQDDRQIVRSKQQKRFAAPGETPHVRIAITPLEPIKEGITCL